MTSSRDFFRSNRTCGNERDKALKRGEFLEAEIAMKLA
jgi:hypothetical protein